MSHNEQLAAKVVAIFRDNISAEARGHISDAEFHDLQQIVREALSEELLEAVEMIEQVARRLRSMTERVDLEL